MFCQDSIAAGCEQEGTNCTANCSAIVDSVDQIGCLEAYRDTLDCFGLLSDICEANICEGQLDACFDNYCADNPDFPDCSS